MNTTRALDMSGSILRTSSLLAGLAAAFLWLWVFMLEAARLSAGPLCSEATGLLEHCPLCYPAAIASGLALAGWTATLRPGRQAD